MATISEYSTSPVPDPIVFDDARINPGGHYDPTTGIYTVPQDGTYEFYVHLLNADENNSLWAFRLVVDDVSVDYTMHTDNGDDPDYVSEDSSEFLELSSGQQISVTPTNMEDILGTNGNLMFSWFSGRLIKAD